MIQFIMSAKDRYVSRKLKYSELINLKPLSTKDR